MLSSRPEADKAKFAHSLVNPDKSVRDKTLKTLRSYLGSVEEFGDFEALELWKALYYCMWLCDRSEVQMELSSSLCELIEVFKTEKLSFAYVQAFCKTILREWHHIDQHRINKFYSLVRHIIYGAFEFLKKKSWNPEAINSFLVILENEILSKTPNGVRLQVTDVYLTELAKVTKGRIETKLFMHLLTPFVKSVLRKDDIVYIERVFNSIFSEFLDTYSRENGQAGDSGRIVFEDVRTEILQKTIFDLASAESTLESCRKRLYNLHKQIGAKTGINFVTDEVVANLERTGNGKKRSSSITSTDSKTTSQPADRSTKKQKKSAESVLATPVPAPVRLPATAAPVPTKVNEEQAKNKAAEAPTDNKKGHKRAPTDVGSKCDEVAAAATESEEAFIPSKKFEGQKMGYYFRKDKLGVGYYREVPVKIGKMPPSALKMGKSPQGKKEKVTFSKHGK